MSRNDGSAAESAFDGFVNGLGKNGYLHHFVDTKRIKGMVGKKGFSIAQPGDRLVAVKPWGGLFLCEVKSTEHKTRFNKSLIRENQWASALRCTAAGGAYFFFVRRELDHQWFKIPAEFLIENEKPSWTWEELTPFKWNLSI